MQNPEGNRIIVDLYIGSFGPTIRIDLKTRQHLHSLLNVLRNLVTNHVAVYLEQVPDFALSGMESFVLQTVPATLDMSKHLRVSGDDNPKVTWKQSGEDWESAVKKIEVFAASDAPGHHYLTSEGIDDALVEVAYRE